MTQPATPAVLGRFRFEALDAWRGICALLVAFLHAPFYDPFRDAPALDNLQFCVDVFFVLSGFVLMHGFGARLATGAAVGRFAIVRLGRLWPLHVVVLVAFVLIECARFAAARHGGGMAFALEPFGPRRTPGEIADNLMMVQAIGPSGGLSWNFPAWSIAVEFWTSLVFAGLVWLYGPSRPLPFVTLALASGLALHALSPATPLVIERWGLLRCLCDFSVGCLAYQIRGRLSPIVLGTTALGKTALGKTALGKTALEIGVVVVAAAFVAMVRPGPLGFVAPLLCGTFVLVFSFERGAASRLLRAPIIQALGRWSFSIYMLHVLVYELVRSAAHLAEARLGRPLLVAHGDGLLISTGSPGLDLALTLAVLLFAVVPLAALSHRMIERPALAAFKAWAGQMQIARPYPRG